MTELAIRYSWDSLALMGDQIMDNAEESMRSTIVKFSDGKKSVYLDDGAKISVEFRLTKRVDLQQLIFPEQILKETETLMLLQLCQDRCSVRV